MAKKFRSDVEKGLHRVPITISKEMEEWFYKVSLEMKEKGGYKLPKSYIIRAILNAVMRLKIDLKNIKSEKDLEEKIVEAVKKYK